MMETHVFPTPEVSGALQHFVEARLHTDFPEQNGEQIAELQQHYTGTVTMPVYVVVDPESEEALGRVDGARRDPFLNLLNKTTAE
ncbi:MAG: hypothetical protein AAF628_02900 [Planctomycetota bacterium]